MTSSSDEFEFSEGFSCSGTDSGDEEEQFQSSSDLVTNKLTEASTEHEVSIEHEDSQMREELTEEIGSRDYLLQKLISQGGDAAQNQRSTKITPEELAFAIEVKSKNIEQLEEVIQANQAFQKKLEEKVHQVCECIDKAGDMRDKIVKCYQEHVKLRRCKQSERKKYLDVGAGKRKWASFWNVAGYTPPKPTQGSQGMHEIINLKMQEKINWSKAEDDALIFGLLQYSICGLQLKGIKERDDGFPVQHEIARQQALAQKLRKLTIKSRRVLDYIDAMGKVEWDDMIAKYCSHYHSYQDCFIRWINHLHPNINKQPFTEWEDEKIVSLVMKNFSFKQVAEELDSKRRAWQVHDRFVELSDSISESLVYKKWTITCRLKLKEAVQSCNYDWELVSQSLGWRYAPFQCYLKHQECLQNNQYQKDETTTNPVLLQQVKIFKRSRKLERISNAVDGWTVEHTELVIKAANAYLNRRRKDFASFKAIIGHIFPEISENQLHVQIQRIFQNVSSLKKQLPKTYL